MRQPWQADAGVVKRLMQYQAAHQHPVNRLLHFVGIPSIMCGVVLGTVALTQAQSLLVLVGFMLAFGLASMLLHLLCKGGLAGWGVAALVGAFFWLAQSFDSNTTRACWGVGLFVAGWVLQIPGHIIFEKNRPQFLTSLGQAFEAAPLHFVHDLATLVLILFGGTWRKKTIFYD